MKYIGEKTTIDRKREKAVKIMGWCTAVLYAFYVSLSATLLMNGLGIGSVAQLSKSFVPLLLMISAMYFLTKNIN